MIIIYGLKDFGTIDGADGTQRATRFFHLYYLPLIPVGGREWLPDGNVREAPLDLKSMGIAYARVWGFALAVGLAVTSYLKLEKSLVTGGVWTVATALVLFGVLALWFWAGLKSPSKPLNLALGFGIPFLALAVVAYAGVNERLRRDRFDAEYQKPSKTSGVSPEAMAFIETMANQEKQSRLEKLEARCDAGEAKACNEVGYQLGKTDPVAARRAYQRACDAKLGMACFNLGVTTVKSDPVAAADYYDLACQYGYADGCNNFATTFDKTSPKKAVELLTRACELDSRLGCSNLAKRYESGKGGVKKNKKQALAYFQRACSLGDTAACSR